MIHITKKEVKAFGEFIEGGGRSFSGEYFYCGKPMSRWLMFRFRFAFWRMKTFRLFEKPLYLRDDTVKSP